MRIMFPVVAILASTVCRGEVTPLGLPLPESIRGADGTRMVLVPAGRFVMGTGEERAEEGPARVLDLPAFYIDQCEVTCEHYARFCVETGHTPPVQWSRGQVPESDADLPVTNVSWFDAMAYAAWAGKRLPTEAEWEKAARGADGRLFPWGGVDDESRRNLDSDGLTPVGRYPTGAGPYGALDLCGNAWEWTADWFLPYPGFEGSSIDFGRHYKTVRGGGGEYLYGADSHGKATERAHLPPYGAHDYLGFRCVRDPDPERPAYRSSALVAEARELLDARLQDPRPLVYEERASRLRELGRIPVRVTGVAAGQAGVVRTGFPLPRGLLFTGDLLGVSGPDGDLRPVQQRTTAVWPDESLRWVLLDFPATAGESLDVLLPHALPARPPSIPSALEVGFSSGRSGSVDSGGCRFAFGGPGLISDLSGADGEPLVRRLDLSITAGTDADPETVREYRALVPERVFVQEQGPLCTAVRLIGRFGADARAVPFEYDLTVTVRAGEARLGLLLTLTNRAERAEPWDARTPAFLVRDVRVAFALARPVDRVGLGTHTARPFTADACQVQLDQLDENLYSVRVEGGEPVAEGPRAAGWVRTRWDGERSLSLGVRHFWQNAPKALFADEQSVGVRLWSGSDAFHWEAGLAKTHELVLDTGSPAEGGPILDPLRVSLDPDWACASRALGPLLPRGEESLSHYPYWDLQREWLMQDFVRRVPYGFRDFGDKFMGTGTKGIMAFNNLEYDYHYNFFMEYLRTGERWYLDTGEIMSRHQADIDTNHGSGQSWKHSPYHTTTAADLAHMFVRGLLMHHLLTGDERSLEVAVHIGDHIAERLMRNDGTGNERQVGFALYNMMGVYEVTREERFLAAARHLCDRLVQGQAANGKFPIRYDNRIAFMNGYALDGLSMVHDQTDDPRLYKTILLLADRTLGMYPEYAGRTLNGFAWVVERTQAAKYIDILERTWVTTTANLGSGVVAGTFGYRFPRFGVRHRLMPLFERIPEPWIEPRSWRGFRIEVDRLQAFVRNHSDEVAVVMVVREGMVPGRVLVLDRGGETVADLQMRAADRMYEGTCVPVPPRGEVLLRLETVDGRGWQIHADERSRVTLYNRFDRWRGKAVQERQVGTLTGIFPRAYGFAEQDARHLKVRVAAVGEGFHRAALISPDGDTVAAFSRFIEYGDEGRYVADLEADTEPGARGWALELSDVEIAVLEGFSAYWAPSVRDLFQPETEALTDR